MLLVNTEVNTDYIVSSCWQLTWYLFLENKQCSSLFLSKHELNYCPSHHISQCRSLAVQLELGQFKVTLLVGSSDL